MTPADNNKKPRVLVVDDDAAVRLLAAETLETNGYQAVVAAGAEQGLACAAKTPVDLILLDLLMPQMDGFAFLAALRARPECVRLPVIVMTALEDQASVDQAYAAGATDFIAKPVHWPMLHRRVRFALRSYELLAEVERFEAVVRFSDDAIITYALDGPITSWNPGAEKMFGYSAKEAVGRHARFLLPPERITEEIRIFEKFALGERAVHFDTERLCKNGSCIGVSVTISPIFDGKARCNGASMIARDITARKRAEEELRVAATVFQAQEGILVTDASETILRVNRAFTDITGFSEQEVIGNRPSILKSGRHDDDFYRKMHEDLTNTGYWQGEIWGRKKDGNLYPKWLSITAVKDTGGVVTHYVGCFSDISERKMAEEAIHNLAYYDPLTRLPNRRLFNDRMRQGLASSARTGKNGALLFLDLDHFKTLNDSKGHQCGDRLLIEVARRLEFCLREEDTVARLGGDEFVVMLENLDEDAGYAANRARLVGEKIVAALRAPYALNGYEHISSCSLGIALFHGMDTDADTLLKQADMAMYEAKKAGRNTLRFFEPAIQKAMDERAAQVTALHKALSSSQFKLYYQVQVDHFGHPIGVEALLRWPHPELGFIPPTAFIPLAEEANLMPEIGGWVLETACAQLKQWASLPYTRNIGIAVNVSALQFNQPDFVEMVESLAGKYSLDPAKLKLELTESVVLDKVEEAVGKMKRLKAHGFGLSLDDFGVGYSSLSYLRQLPFDQIKIDQSFVRGGLDNPNDAFIVMTVFNLGALMDIQVIAEGVETGEQRDFLLKLGCRAFQGYLFGKPMPAEELELSLKQKWRQQEAAETGSDARQQAGNP